MRRQQFYTFLLAVHAAVAAFGFGAFAVVSAFAAAAAPPAAFATGLIVARFAA